MEELLKEMQEARERMYKQYQDAELVEDAEVLAYIDGQVSGMDMMIGLVKKNMK